MSEKKGAPGAGAVIMMMGETDEVGRMRNVQCGGEGGKGGEGVDKVVAIGSRSCCAEERLT